MSFLPIKASEVTNLPLDIVLISGDAYCDHPSFGHAIVSRLVEYMGLSIGIIPQPQKDSDYMEFGQPKYGFFISGGVVDSMVNNYTVAKIRRTEDVYSDGGDFGKRPDRCVNVYCNTLKRLYPDTAVVIGGIEASLRRFAHYDYWADKVLPSILVTSKADLLIYGMGEKPIMDICQRLLKGIPLAAIRDVRGVCYMDKFDNLSAKLKQDIQENKDLQFCPSYDNVIADKTAYVKAFNTQAQNADCISGKLLLQKHGELYLVQNPPQLACSESELDAVYSLPYERTFHPSYTRGIPAIEEVKYSITSHRGCFGGCNYCALTYHQGRVIQKRSQQNIIEEAEKFIKDKDFKGYIHDVGGPTANFRNQSCELQSVKGVCQKKQCIGFDKCKNLKISHSEYLSLLRKLREMPGVKKVFIRSGIRFDYVLYDENPEFFNELVKHHISGQLKVAPEHVDDKVLKIMNKPSFSVYKAFKERYDSLNVKYNKKQFLVPYLISSHPGADLKSAVKVAEYLKSINYMPEQVQDFYPTPSTKSTCMYYTGINPDTMEDVYVPRAKEEKRMQRALLQYRKKENYDIVHQALEDCGRTDLIGFTENCLIKPSKEEAIQNSLHRKVNGMPTYEQDRAKKFATQTPYITQKPKPKLTPRKPNRPAKKK